MQTHPGFMDGTRRGKDNNHEILNSLGNHGHRSGYSLSGTGPAWLDVYRRYISLPGLCGYGDSVGLGEYLYPAYPEVALLCVHRPDFRFIHAGNQRVLVVVFIMDMQPVGNWPGCPGSMGRILGIGHCQPGIVHRPLIHPRASVTDTT